MFLDYFFYSILCQCNNVSSILTTGTSCVGSVYSSAALCLSGYILLRGITREQWPGNYVLTGNVGISQAQDVVSVAYTSNAGLAFTERLSGFIRIPNNGSYVFQVISNGYTTFTLRQINATQFIQGGVLNLMQYMPVVDIVFQGYVASTYKTISLPMLVGQIYYFQSNTSAASIHGIFFLPSNATTTLVKKNFAFSDCIFYFYNH
jgi:hypothetical protein